MSILRVLTSSFSPNSDNEFFFSIYQTHRTLTFSLLGRNKFDIFIFLNINTKDIISIYSCMEQQNFFFFCWEICLPNYTWCRASKTKLLPWLECRVWFLKWKGKQIIIRSIYFFRWSQTLSQSLAWVHCKKSVQLILD